MNLSGKKIQFKSKKSDLNQKNWIFLIFIKKITIYINPGHQLPQQLNYFWDNHPMLLCCINRSYCRCINFQEKLEHKHMSMVTNHKIPITGIASFGYMVGCCCPSVCRLDTPKATTYEWKDTIYWPLHDSVSYKVTLGINRKPICDFLLINNTSLQVHPTSHHFQDIVEY